MGSVRGKVWPGLVEVLRRMRVGLKYGVARVLQLLSGRRRRRQYWWMKKSEILSST